MWIPLNKIELMLELARNEDKLAVVKERKGEIVYRLVEKDVDGGQFSMGNFELNLITGIVHGKGLKIYYHSGEFYYMVVRSTEVLPEVVDIREMEYNGKKRKVPICIIDGILYPDINSLAMRIFSEVNPVTIKQTFSWASQFRKITRGFSSEVSGFRLSDFEAMGPHYSNRGNKSGYSFLHSKLGFISGLGELRDKFPDLSTKQVRSIYREFGLTPSTNIPKLWGPKAQEDRFNKWCKKHGVYYDSKLGVVSLKGDAMASSDLAEVIGITEKEAEVFWDWVKNNKVGKSTSKTSSGRTTKPS